MLKQWLLEQARQVKNTFTSFTNTEKRSLFFYSLYALISLLVLFSQLSLANALILILLIILSWKILFGLSWLNFCYLIIGFIELEFLSNWLKPFWLGLGLFLFLVLIFQKIILNQKKTNSWLAYLISTGWIFSASGIYFYFNQPFLVSFIFYTSGLALLTYLNFVMLDKKVSLNYLVYLLVNLEIYWLLSYLSLNGLQFALVILLFQYLSLSFM